MSESGLRRLGLDNDDLDMPVLSRTDQQPAARARPRVAGPSESPVCTVLDGSGLPAGPFEEAIR